MPREADRRTIGRLSVYRHVNLTVLSFSSPFWTSQVPSVMRIGARTSGSTSFVSSGSIRNTSYDENSWSIHSASSEVSGPVWIS